MIETLLFGHRYAVLSKQGRAFLVEWLANKINKRICLRYNVLKADYPYPNHNVVPGWCSYCYWRRALVESLMLLKGDVIIYAPRKIVRDFRMDPNRIGQCDMGVEKFERHP